MITELKITYADVSDMEKILKLQYAAYQSEALIHGDFTIQPLTQTLDESIAEYNKGIVLKAVLGNEIIGSVRAYVEGNTAYIGKLMVHPNHQGKGFGKQLIAAIEQEFPYKRYEIFTSCKSDRNLHIYETTGYTRFREETVAGITFAYLEKQDTGRSAKEVFNHLFEHQYLTREDARILLRDIAEGKYNESQIAALITVYLMRSISVDELMGFREALLEMSLAVDFSDYPFIDIVGTGGDGKNTFNISTAACFVVAGAGYCVAKHGNYGASSISGASNVMEQLGVRFTTDRDRLRKSMKTCGMAYLHAPLFNPALKAVAPVRKNLGVRTFFNVLGPLVNPAKPKFQLLGVYSLPMLRLYSYVYQESGIRFGVVHSLDGYDEISLTGEFKIALPEWEKIYSPEMLSMERCVASDLYGGETPEHAALIFKAVLERTASQAQMNSVIANAAFAIRILCPEKAISTCIEEATDSLISGKALGVLKKFVEVNR
jgi:anthranilate phosphoribosyltransferase